MHGKFRFYIRMMRGKPAWPLQRLQRSKKEDGQWHRFEIDFDKMTIKEIETP